MAKKKKTIKQKKYQMNKRGDGENFLTSHVFGILVAVVCLAFLIFLAVIVYNWFSTKSDLDKAEANIKLISGEIEMIQASSGNNAGNIIIYPPANWVLRSYLDSFPQTECYGKISCLCLCEKVTCEGVQKICYGYNYKVEVNNSYVVQKSWIKRFFVDPEQYPHAIGFSQAAEGVKIYKQEDKIMIDQIITNKKD